MLNGMHETLLVVETRCFRVEMQSRCKSNSVNVYCCSDATFFLLARPALLVSRHGIKILFRMKLGTG